MIILIGVYKSKTENTLQLWSKEDAYPLVKLWTIKDFRTFKYFIDDVHEKWRPKRNDKLGLIREVFDISNQYLQDKYVPGTCVTIDKR